MIYVYALERLRLNTCFSFYVHLTFLCVYMQSTTRNTSLQPNPFHLPSRFHSLSPSNLVRSSLQSGFNLALAESVKIVVSRRNILITVY